MKQKIKGGADSICPKCFHSKVCRARDNQPCVECNQFVDANGVTIQRWIPVTERLPEDDISSARYLCYANGYVRILKYWRMYKSFEYGGKPIKVTHWMPLPEAPKGE